MKKRQRIRKAAVIFAFLLFPVIIFYFSPYLIVLGAIEGIAAGSVIMFLFLFLLPSLFFGRVVCGYVCPVGGLQECLMLANPKKAKGGRLNLIKYCLWVPWILTIVLLFLRAGGIKELDFFFHTEFGVSLYAPVTYFIYYGVVLLVVILALTAGKRAFCHYVCWMAPFMVLGTKLSGLLRLPRLRLKAEKESCIACGRCSGVCPMSLDAGAMAGSGNMASSECILCGECIDICPKNTIHYTFR